MRSLRLVDMALRPQALELELLRRLKQARVRGTERLRITIKGRRLCLDGFVISVYEKFEVEKACKALAPGSVLVNRLRVASAEEKRVS